MSGQIEWKGKRSKDGTRHLGTFKSEKYGDIKFYIKKSPGGISHSLQLSSGIVLSSNADVNLLKDLALGYCV